jgi:acetolactate synthase-1/2/3 large subunit
MTNIKSIKTTGADAIIEFLKRNDYTHIFGLPGRRILPLYDAAYRSGGITMVVPQHEQGGSYMADCMSRINGKGCCVGISGPGAMNLLNGVAASYADSVPLLAIGGQAQVANFGKYAIQESTGIGRTPNQLGLFKCVTKHSERVESIDDLVPALERAYTAMHEGRKGPAYLEIPTNILLEETESGVIRSCKLDKIRSQSLKAEQSHINSLLDLLRSAKRPLLLLGNGVVLSESGDLAREIAELLEMPVATTLLGKGVFDEGHRLALGCVGIWGQKSANTYMLEEADLLLAIGTTFQELSTLGWRSASNMTVVRVDLDATELNRNFIPAVPILSDAREFFMALLQALKSSNLCGLEFVDAAAKANELRERFGYYETFKMTDYANEQLSKKIKPYDLLKAIGTLRGRDDVLVFDVGENGYFSEFLIKSYARRTYLTNAGLGSMGFSVAGAVGAALAAPERVVIAVCGDGGFLMNCNELATATQYGVRVIWCVLNNGILGTQMHYQRDHCDGRYVGCWVPPVDIEMLGRSMGVESHTVHDLEQFRQRFKEAREQPKATLLNIITDESSKPIPPFFF